MDKKTYKNISDKDLMLPNIGFVKAGEKIDTVLEVANKNFKEIEKEEISKPAKIELIKVKKVK